MKATMIKLASTAILIASAASGLFAKSMVSEIRNAEVTLQVTRDLQMEIESKDTRLTVETWDQQKVQVNAVVEFKGESSQEIMDFLDNFQEVVEDGIFQDGDYLKVSTLLDEPNKVEMGTRLFKFVQISYSEKELAIRYTIKVPRTVTLQVRNAYEDLNMNGEYSGDVELKHYSGDLTGGSFANLNMELKYGDAVIERVGKGVFELYEQKLSIGELKDGFVTAKYTDMKLNKVEEIEIDSYESDIKVTRAKLLKGQMKYGSLDILSGIDEMTLYSAYEVDLEGQRVNTLLCSESKYSSFLFREIGKSKFSESYEDEIQLGKAGTFKLKSKYSDVNIDELTGNLDIHDSYETSLELKNISSAVSEISVAGKYLKVSALTNSRSTKLKVDAKYVTLDYDESKFKKVLFVKENSELQAEFVSGQDPSLTLQLTGYEVELSLR